MKYNKFIRKMKKKIINLINYLSKMNIMNS